VGFLGPQFGPAKAACYRNCEAFILPSFSEGLPMAVLEAWSYGKPVLMTSECNLAEGFAAHAALSIEPNVRSIAAGLRALFEMSPTDRERMGQRGVALVRNQFSWPTIADDMRAVYAWIADGGPKPACVIQN
jgi:poly(glycerol-phosphate) alpha-glucosyltransferase